MTRYIALLRAINVGGRNVTMEALRAHFASLGLTRIETFIASGNVIFESEAADEDALRQQIEAHLRLALGFPVAAFLRRDSELAATVAHEAFSAEQLAGAQALNVGFLHQALDPAACAKLTKLATDIDDFHTEGRAVYWLCRKKQSDSTFSNALFERKFGIQATFRSMTTLRKLSALYPPDDAAV